MNNTKVMTGMDKTSTSKMENCLVIIYAPYETGAPDFMMSVRKYPDAAQALMAYADTACHDSEVVTEDTARLCVDMSSELISSIKSGMSLYDAMQDWDLI